MRIEPLTAARFTIAKPPLKERTLDCQDHSPPNDIHPSERMLWFIEQLIGTIKLLTAGVSGDYSVTGQFVDTIQNTPIFVDFAISPLLNV